MLLGFNKCNLQSQSQACSHRTSSIVCNERAKIITRKVSSTAPFKLMQVRFTKFMQSATQMTEMNAYQCTFEMSACLTSGRRKTQSFFLELLMLAFSICQSLFKF